MDARELRIGNYVQDIKGEICKVSNLNIEDTENYIRAWKIDMPAFGTVNPYPIPITEEWLLKFGFEAIDNGTVEYEKDFGVFPLRFNKGNIYFHDSRDWNSKLDGKIKYVHQLQNLYFALTGKELQIK